MTSEERVEIDGLRAALEMAELRLHLKIRRHWKAYDEILATQAAQIAALTARIEELEESMTRPPATGK